MSTFFSSWIGVPNCISLGFYFSVFATMLRFWLRRIRYCYCFEIDMCRGSLL